MQSESARSDGVPLILWIAGGVVALFLDSDAAGVGADIAQPTTAILAIGFGVWVFWRHGGHQVTAAGLYSLASAIFVGFAGVYWWLEPRAVSNEAWIATLTGYWTNIGLYLFWRRPPNYRRLPVASTTATHWGAWMGLLVGGIGLLIGLRLGGNAVAFALAGMALLMVSLMLHRAQGESVAGRLIIAGVVVAVFWQVVFTGYGRLNLAALGLVGLVLASARTGSRWIKTTMLAGVGPALALFVLAREQLGVELSGTEYDGLGSVVNPLHDFGELVTAHGDGIFALGHGETFLATLLFWVPSSVWPGKPPGLGSELTRVLEPELLAFGHSIAAHNYGEWFYNFGWIGVAMMVPVVGLLLRGVDRWLARVPTVDSRRSLLWLVMCLLVVANVPNLMWVGSFTYIARTGQELLILAILVLPTATRVAANRQPPAKQQSAGELGGIARPQ